MKVTKNGSHHVVINGKKLSPIIKFNQMDVWVNAPDIHLALKLAKRGIFPNCGIFNFTPQGEPSLSLSYTQGVKKFYLQIEYEDSHRLSDVMGYDL